ncbi:hypothetical protein MP638_005637 [Amoeboaphelidium occidentale]|nr:hypothetical protein MP638_005637 [Amoeboaphelidium occidentale]
MFKSKKLKNSNIRKRSNEDDDTSVNVDDIKAEGTVEQSGIAANAQKKARSDKLTASSGKHANESILPAQLSHSASGAAASLLPEDLGATAVQEIDTAKEHDRRTYIEKSLQINAEREGVEDDDVYRGQVAYNQYAFRKDADGKIISSKLKYGPTRASTGIRVTARFDYQPHVCKDYKETGYCGYGDSCIFMHDRGNYKSGWQLDKEWEEEQRKKKAKELGLEVEEEEDDEKSKKDKETELPFACLLCRKEFTDPVVTKCNHYFCEECALKHFKKSPKCFACGLPTHGIYSIAKNIVAKQREKDHASDLK